MTSIMESSYRSADQTKILYLFMIFPQVTCYYASHTVKTIIRLPSIYVIMF